MSLGLSVCPTLGRGQTSGKSRSQSYKPPTHRLKKHTVTVCEGDPAIVHTESRFFTSAFVSGAGRERTSVQRSPERVSSREGPTRTSPRKVPTFLGWRVVPGRPSSGSFNGGCGSLDVCDWSRLNFGSDPLLPNPSGPDQVPVGGLQFVPVPGRWRRSGSRCTAKDGGCDGRLKGRCYDSRYDTVRDSLREPFTVLFRVRDGYPCRSPFLCPSFFKYIYAYIFSFTLTLIGVSSEFTRVPSPRPPSASNNRYDLLLGSSLTFGGRRGTSGRGTFGGGRTSRVVSVDTDRTIELPCEPRVDIRSKQMYNFHCILLLVLYVCVCRDSTFVSLLVNVKEETQKV